MARLTREQRKQVAEFIFVCARAENRGDKTEDEIKHVARHLMSLAKRARRYNEMACSVPMTPRQERNQEKTDDIAVELCRSVGWGINVNGDPRGYALKVVFPDGAWNTGGGKDDGYGVPEVSL